MRIPKTCLDFRGVKNLFRGKFCDARFPCFQGLVGGVYAPVGFVALALAKDDETLDFREFRGQDFEHVLEPFGLAAAVFGARKFCQEHGLVIGGKSVVGGLENFGEGLPMGPALCGSPVVAVYGSVVHIVVARVGAGEGGACAAACVCCPDPLHVSGALCSEAVF